LRHESGESLLNVPELGHRRSRLIGIGGSKQTDGCEANMMQSIHGAFSPAGFGRHPNLF
jgi:hypothetical protein